MGEATQWHRDAVARLRASGHDAHLDSPDSILLAEARNLAPANSAADKIMESLAADLAGHSAQPITRATCATMARAAADLRGWAALTGASAHEVLALLSGTAAKLELKAQADG